MDDVKQLPGARESSAGDDFHLLWAGRKALSLLMPNSDLIALSIEGPHREEASFLDPEGDQLLAIDLAEYYGGDRFDSAELIVLSQLKYSTRTPEKDWTAARLSEGKASGEKKTKTNNGIGSIVHRLAQTFQRYYNNYGQVAVLQKLVLKLVSNRPASELLTSALAEAKDCLVKQNLGLTKTLLKSLSANHSAEIQRLFVSSRLGSKEFLDFLRVLDVTECGQNSRFGQSINLLKELGEFGPGDVAAQYTQLKSLVWDYMMPEAADKPPLTKYDILPIFKCSYRDLFPAEPYLDLPNKVLERNETTQLAERLQTSRKNLICLHSGGGKGKTTLVQSLKNILPAHSVVIVFDCYGRGNYLNPADTRHSHYRAIPQIVNELATQVGGPLLLRLSLTSEDYMRELITRIETAVSLIRKSNPEALVVVVIDAADNSVSAAREKKEKSFVHDIVSQPFPKGSRLVVTCRTENLSMLDLPDHEPLELKGFAKPESAKHLRMYFSDATEFQVDDFHRLTQGIPRVQGYALELRHQGLDAVLCPLRPDGKSLGGLIESWLDEAKKRHGVPQDIDKICEALVALPRPVPITYVAALAQVLPETIKSLCVDTRLGLIDNHDAISFSDQDFEDHLRLRIVDKGRLIEAISDLLYKNRNIDGYAAYHVDTFLARTDRFKDLSNLVLQENIGSSIISNPLERQELILKRIRSAVELGKNEKDRSVIIKLLWYSAETVKTDKAVRALIIDNADLAEEFGDPQVVQRLHLDIEKKQDWPVASLFHSAAVLSRFTSTRAKADEKLKEAFGWLRWSSTQKEDKRGLHRYFVKSEDVAAGLEAMFRLQGVAKVKEWLNRLNRHHSKYDCVYYLASKILRVDGVEVLEQSIATIPMRADSSLAILKAYRESNHSVPAIIVERAARIWYRFGRCGGIPAKEILAEGIILCEEIAKMQSLRNILPDIVALFSPPALNYMPYLSGEDINRVVGILCSRTLQSRLTNQQLTLNDFLPDELLDTKEDLPYKEQEDLKTRRREFDQVFGFLLPAYELRADVIFGSISPELFESHLDECIGKIARDYEVRWRNNAVPVYRLMAQALAEAAIMVSGIATTWVDKLTRAVSHNQVGGINFLRLLLAERMVALPKMYGKVLQLLDQVRQDLEKAPGTARELIDLLLQCTRIASAVDSSAARYYFNLAVEAASEIDEEVFTQINCMASFADKISSELQYSNAELAYQFARFVEGCHRRMDGWDHFPWDEALQGLFSLDSASAFAILSRWDERGVRNIESEIVTLLIIAIQRRYISPEMAHALSILSVASGNEYEQLILEILNAAQTLGGQAQVIECLSLIAEDIRLFTPIVERKSKASAVMIWANNHNVGHSQGAICLKDLLNFLEGTYKKSVINDTAWKMAENLEVPNWEQILGNQPFLASDEIEVALDEVRKIEKYGHNLQKELLHRLQQRCTVRDYTKQLDALLQVKSEKLSISSLLEALESCIQEWSFHPSVRDWQKEKCTDFLARRLSEMIYYGSRSRMVKRFQTVFDIVNADLYKCTVDVLPQFVGNSAEATYELIHELTVSLTPTEAENVLQWLLERFSSKISADCADGQWCEELRPPKESLAIVSKFIWRLLGHPDKRLRWRAAHAVRRMVRQGFYEIVDSLVLLCGDKHCAAMIDHKHDFFWLSARLWTFILLDRLAAEAPNAIKHHSEKIIKEALAPEVPHALIRHFAQAAAMALSKHDSGIYSKSDITALSAINKSPFPPRKVRSRHRSDNGDKNTKKLRFKFDSTDTLPYWYDPLSRVFAETRNTVAQMAEIWICDKWGIPADISYRRDWIQQKYHFSLYSNGHGSDPTVETIQNYAEWHAMFCTANELLKTHPVKYDEWENDPYSNWLKRWTLNWPGYWLADLRDSLPLEDIHWYLSDPIDDNWTQQISQDAFDPLIGLNNTSIPEVLVLHGYYRRAVRGASESMYISSALVTPDNALALLRALQTSVNPNQDHIPLEGDEEDEFPDGFELKGWLRMLKSEWDSGIDETDPLRNHLSSSLVVPGSDFVSWANLEYSSDRKRYWQHENVDKPVTTLECWDEQPKTDREDRGFYSEGHRLWVHVNTLLEYLKERQRCLIVKCMIDRWADKEGTGKYVPGKAKIYLIHEDGTLETLRERYCIREKTC